LQSIAIIVDQRFDEHSSNTVLICAVICQSLLTELSRSLD